MIRKDIADLLAEKGQKRFLAEFEALSHTDQEIIARQVLYLDFDLIARMQEVISRPPLKKEDFSPYDTPYQYPLTSDVEEIGKEALREMRCGAIIVAGGQGSRLRFDKPKGCFPITIARHKSLFQFFAEKCKAASKQAGVYLPLAIMTSLDNHAETCAFFAENAFFGLLPSQISFFVQPSLPALDFEGNLLLETPNKIALAPTGNGAVFSAFIESGIYRRWKERGIERVTFSQIDNPLSDPFDPSVIGFHIKHGLDVAMKAIRKLHETEKLGVIVQKPGGKLGVAEYSEISEHTRHAKDEGNRLLYSLANISYFCFSISFILKASNYQMPLHAAKKAIKVCKQGNALPGEPNGYKFEYFVFDAFDVAEKCEAIAYPRNVIYAPLKNFQGEDSIATVQAALLESDRKAFEKVTGTMLSDHKTPFELSLGFHYPTGELLEKWRGKPLPSENYINEDGT